MSTHRKYASMLLTEALERKLRSIAAEGHNSKKTASWYQECVKGFSTFLEEKRIEPTVGNLTVDNVEWYLADLRTRFDARNKKEKVRISPNTVANRARGLRALSNWLFERDYTKEHQLAKLSIPKPVLEDPEIVEPHEIQKLLNRIDFRAAYGYRDACVILMLYDLGLRAGELCNLTMEDVHLEGKTGWVYVKASTTKSRKPRPVPLGARLHEMLTNYVERYRDNVTIRQNKPTDHLFRNRNGQKFTTNGILEILYRRSEEAGIRRLHPHLLRHSSACLSIEAGTNELFVKQKLGHSDLGMTDYYSHLAARRSILKQQKAFSLADQITIKEDKPRKTRNDKGKPRKVKPIPPQLRAVK